jgi:hypothetical protein
MFFVAALALLALRVGMAYLALPPRTADALSLLATVVFLGVPILMLFRAAEAVWTPKLALAFVAGGLAAHAGGVALVLHVVGDRGFASVVTQSVTQTGLMFWCVGAGGLLATLIKDKNILLPVGFFLAGLDVFLVTAPDTFLRRIVEEQPEVFRKVAYHLPQVGTEATVGFVVPLAHVGPADFFFLAMFFIAIHKFAMRTKATLIWIAPVLLAYLFVVIYLGHLRLGPVSLGMLPALLPIGAVVLIVNVREFRLAAQEKLATVVVALLGLALAAGGISLAARAERAAPSPPAAAPGVPEPAASPPPAGPVPRP